MSTESFVQALFAKMGDWFADLSANAPQSTDHAAQHDEVRHG